LKWPFKAGSMGSLAGLESLCYLLPQLVPNKAANF